MIKKLVFMNCFDDWNLLIPGVDGIDTLEAYQDMTDLANKIGIEIYIASFNNIESHTATVSKAWRYIDKQWVKLTIPFKPQLIVSKIPARLCFETFEFRSQLATNVELINDPGFSTFIGDKFNQYLIFSQYMATTFLVKNKFELLNQVEKLQGNSVVFKKAFGSGGSKVRIVEKNQPFDDVVDFLKFPFLVQQFIKSTMGIPGFDTEIDKYPIVADLRVMFIGRKFMFAISRAATDSLFTNVSKGAIIRYVEPNKVPIAGLKICHEIAEKLAIFGKNILAIDLMFDENSNPLVIEINTKPDPVFNHYAPIKIQEDYLKELVSNESL